MIANIFGVFAGLFETRARFAFFRNERDEKSFAAGRALAVDDVYFVFARGVKFFRDVHKVVISAG